MVMASSYLPSLGWFCGCGRLVCEIIAARGGRRDEIPNLHCLSQVLFTITLICWNLLDTSFLEYFFILSMTS